MIADISDTCTPELSSSASRLAPAVSERILLNVLSKISDEPARVRTDADGRVVAINPAFSNLCGYRFEEIHGRKPGSLLQGPETTRDSILEIRHAIQNRQKCSVVMVNYHKNQSPYTVRIELEPLFSPSGLLQGFEAKEKKLA